MRRFILGLFCFAAPDKSCGGILRNSSGYITAPDLDKDGYYDFNLNCVWLIQVNSSKVILYHFDYIAIIVVQLDKCKPDYVKVRAKELIFFSK